jgi:hypothetical protein
MVEPERRSLPVSCLALEGWPDLARPDVLVLEERVQIEQVSTLLPLDEAAPYARSAPESGSAWALPPGTWKPTAALKRTGLADA